MAKGGSGLAAPDWKAGRSPLNSGAPWPTPEAAEARVLGIQRKLHKWASDDPNRRFCDLHNLVCDPATLVVAWSRVRGNRGSRSAGVDGQTAFHVEQVLGVERFLAELREELRSGSFRPLPVKERLIPKPSGRGRRRLGVPTVRDRVVQAALKLVLEPVFEADFEPCSYGFRPGRRAQDAIAEIHYLASRSYEWIVEADIEACFDSLDHSAVLGRVRARVGDRRVLRLVKAFLKAGILTEQGGLTDPVTGTAQGGILSPLISNVALSALDRHYAEAWRAMGQNSGQRQTRRLRGEPTYRLVRYADDFVVMVAGERRHAEALVAETARVIAPLGLRLAREKTRVTHIGEGFDFLGFTVKRSRGRHGQPVIHTYPSRRSLQSVKDAVRRITRTGHNQSLDQLLHRLNPVLRGWCAYFRHGVSKQTFNYLRAFAWRRVVCWLRRKHPKANWRWLRRRYLDGWWPTGAEIALYNPGGVAVTRYRYRGTKIATPWQTGEIGPADPTGGLERLGQRIDG
jgi:RNA-directed DNA polymerase